LREIGGADGLFSDDPSTFGILDLMRSTYSQAGAYNTFAFDGSDRKVKAFLVSYFRSNLHWPHSPVHVLDLGAHRGGFLNAFIQSASSFSGSNKNLHVVSFEPNPSSFKSLRTKVERGLGDGVSVSLVQGAVSNETKKGHIFVPSGALEIGYGVAVSELASISADSAPAGFVGVPTHIWSLDDWFSSELGAPEEISFMKIDVEGFEPLVFDGAQKLLEGSLRNVRGELIVPPRVILFEYGMGWALAANPATHRLETVVEALRKLGYSSYLLGEKQMLRLDGSCWHDAYEFWFWSNVVAIREEDRNHEKPVPLRTALSTLYSFVIQDI
jgi:FkbM family methyltransferase